MSLPPCHSRHSLPGEKRTFACSHPQVIVPLQRVSVQAANEFQGDQGERSERNR